MNPTPIQFPPPHDSFILVVDDAPKNVQVVGSILSEAGYEVMPATSGPEALQRAQSQPPGLILLDLMMPGMDGLEVCRRFKQSTATADVPIIFLTASGELEHLVKAFECGAVDYLTKPFNGPELLARVRTHLELKHARDALAKQASRLEELNNEKNLFLGIVAHDLRNPISNVLFCARVIEDEVSDDPAQVREMAALVRQSAEHMFELVNNLLDVNALEAGRMRLNPAPNSLSELTSGSVHNFAPKAGAKKQVVHFTRPEDPFVVTADEHATRQVIDNLISNAIKYCPQGKGIHVRLEGVNGSVRLEVRDEGPGLTPEDMRKAFGKFARLSARPTGNETSTGLGLSIVKRMVEASHGRVWCESKPGCGATFVVEWPRANSTTS